MLRGMTLENFKPFGTPQSVDFAGITLIYGPNSSGKSSLIQSLMLMRQSLEMRGTMLARLIPRGDYVDLGTFGALIHKHDLEKEFSISLQYDQARPRRAPYRYLRPDNERRITTRFRAASSPGSSRKDGSELASVHYEFGGDVKVDIELIRAADEPEGTALNLSQFASFRWATEASFKSFVKLAEFMSREPSSLKKHTDEELKKIFSKSKVVAISGLPTRVEFGSPDEPIPEMSGMPFRSLEGVVYDYYDLLESISYMGPLRSHPARHYLVMGGEKNSVGVHGENTPQMLFRRKHQIENVIDTWFKRFEIPYTMEVKNIGNEVAGDIITITLLDKRSKTVVAPSDVGFGIGQLLPIIVEGVTARNRILCVEQPEIHLHPKLQAHVADLLIDTAGLKSPGERTDEGKGPYQNQWLVETHSESLMLRLQRRIREKRISHTDVSVLYVESLGESGSQVIPLRLNAEGEFIDEWPGGFFEDSYRELFVESQR